MFYTSSNLVFYRTLASGLLRALALQSMLVSRIDSTMLAPPTQSFQNTSSTLLSDIQLSGQASKALYALAGAHTKQENSMNTAIPIRNNGQSDGGDSTMKEIKLISLISQYFTSSPYISELWRHVARLGKYMLAI